MLEHINIVLFQAIHGAQPGWRTLLGELAAEWLIMLVPLALVLLWMSGRDRLRMRALQAGLASVAALGANFILGHLWFHPRPFMAGLAENVLHHAPDSSFPSDHGTIMFTVALVLLADSSTRRAGAVVGVAALATAWARVYLGVHWPLDMVGAALMAALMARLVSTVRAGEGCAALLALLLPQWRRILATPIRRGWIRP
jgi:undecaprenyl-diphosphatase